MAKEKIIKIDDRQKARFCKITAEHLSDLLNTKIELPEVLDELSLYEWGMKPKKSIVKIRC